MRPRAILASLPGPLLGWVVRALLVLVAVMAFAIPFVRDLPLLGSVTRPFEAWFDYQCHREAARSFALFGRIMPVCSRCFGIYAGLGLGALVLRPKLDVWPLRIWVAGAAVVMVLDVVTENLGMRPAWGLLRFATGVLLAYPVGAALVVALSERSSSGADAPS